MSNTKLKISYCFGAYNEEEIILTTIRKVKDKLNKICGNNNYEILIVENGSTDNTPLLLKKVKDKNINPVFIKRKSHGAALKTAIKKAKYDTILLTGADLPFGFSDLDQFTKKWKDYDIIYGSKAHPKSIYPTTLKRKISSNIYSLILRLFFGLSMKDTQGSIFLDRKKVLPFLKYCDAENAFFTSQIAIYAARNNLRLKEIPVKIADNSQKRISKYSVKRDGLAMLKSIFHEYMKPKKL